MTTYARYTNGHAVDVITTLPTDTFHSDIAVQFITVPDGTVAGATYDEATNEWTNPAPDVAEAKEVSFAPLDPLAFYLAFTPGERIAVKTATDSMVKEFWETYELAARFDSQINPNLPSIREGLGYLRKLEILARDERIDEIRAGIAQ